jgi:hypothetical protein
VRDGGERLVTARSRHDAHRLGALDNEGQGGDRLKMRLKVLAEKPVESLLTLYFGRFREALLSRILRLAAKPRAAIITTAAGFAAHQSFARST